jgi:hypothetical protein
MLAAELFVSALFVYLLAGVLFAVAFLARGAGRIDPAAQGTGLGFRLIIGPGVVALWPLLLLRWMGSARQ